jgi:hypothetical protein
VLGRGGEDLPRLVLGVVGEARKRLVAADLASLEVDDGLEVSAHAPGSVEDVGKQIPGHLSAVTDHPCPNSANCTRLERKG